jgi:hypothetical protein
MLESMLAQHALHVLQSWKRTIFQMGFELRFMFCNVPNVKCAEGVPGLRVIDRICFELNMNAIFEFDI